MTARTILTLVSLGLCFTSGAGILIYKCVITDGLPALFILYGNSATEAERGIYTWTEYETADFIGDTPPSLVTENPCFPVSPKTPLSFQFTEKPVSVAVYIRQNYKTIKKIVADSSIFTPDAEGNVFYEVVASYKHGTVSYAFSVDVKE